MVHDFNVSSSQKGVEGGEGGITVTLANRSTRKRKRGDTGTTATEVHLPAIKGMVWTLCERVTGQFSTLSFVCFLDNLFVDIPLAKALLSIGVGICGTTRKNAPGIPPVLLAIVHRFPALLPPDGVTAAIVDELVSVTTWYDSLRKNRVLFITTAYRTDTRQLVLRSTARSNATRTTPGGYGKKAVHQPSVAVAYNSFMNATDNFNHLRNEGSVRRPYQSKWTKKFLEFAIDLCRVNAYLIWRASLIIHDLDHRERKEFTRQLITGLLDDQEEEHTPSQRSKRNYCAWKGCQTREYQKRKPLAEVTNSSTKPWTRKTTDYCNKCCKALCIATGCWAAYHRAKRLKIRPQDQAEGEGSTTRRITYCGACSNANL